MLNARYELLLQGAHEDITPEFSSYLTKILHLDFVPDEYSYTRKVKSKKTYPTKLLESEILKEVLDDSIHHYTPYFFEQDLASSDAKFSPKAILEHLDRKGLNVVPVIMQHLAALEKKQIPTASLFLNLLTFDAMEELRRQVLSKYSFDLYLRSDFINAYVARFGNPETSEKSDETDFERAKRVCMRRIEFYKKNKISGIKEELEHLLNLLHNHREYDKTLYMEYLESRSQTSTWDKDYKSYDLHLNSLDKAYLEHLFPQESPKPFYRYFRSRFVTTYYETACLLSGQSIKCEVLTNQQIADLRNQVRFKILEGNKECYRVGDEVSVSVELKNVDVLEWKLFELNTRVYYEKNSTPISTTIDLDGLRPILSGIMHYQLPDFQRHIETFTFPDINHRGCYIVDFFAKGQSCRFLVNMGQLNVLVRESLSGLMLTVLDEQGDRKESNVYVLLDGRKYELNEYHEIAIPYLPPGKSQQTFKALVCEEVEADWVYTEKCDLTIPAESFSLELKGDVDNEALVHGNENCQILLRVSAMLNQIPFPNSLLQDVSITLSFKNMDDIASEIILKPVLKDNEEVMIPLRISKPIQSAKASITASIVTNNGVKKQLSASLNLYSTSFNPRRNLNIEEIKPLFSLLRKRTSQGVEFFVYASGPAGEPYPSLPVSVRLNHLYSTSTFQFSLETDEKGEISLGLLRNVTKVDVNGTVFPLHFETFNVKKSWEVAENEEVQALLPLINDDLANYTLICESSEDEVGSLQSCLKMIDGYVMVSNLKPGRYVLYVRDKNGTLYTIRISVYHASKMNVTEHYAFFGSWARQLSIAPISMTCTQHDQNLTIQVYGASPSAHVHVLIKSFYESLMLGNHIRDFNNPSYGRVQLNPVSSLIVNDRKLPEEYDYIQGRKRENRTLPGIMLPPPGLLMNPVQVDETTTKAKEASAGTNFEEKYENRPGARVSKTRDESDLTPKDMTQKDSRENIRVFSRLLANIQLINGKTEIDLSDYKEIGCEVEVVAVDEGRFLDSVLYYSGSEENRIPLLIQQQALEESLDPSKNYTEEKQISIVTAENPLAIDSKSEMQVLASLEDVWLLLKVLLDDSKLQQFSFLLSWSRLNEKEKMRLYSKYNCSEVNVFIYFRDRPFFDAYLAPSLQSKIEKSFLDVWLTGGDVSRFLQPMFYERLNAFERALLASRVSEEEGAAIELEMKNNAAYNPLSRFAFASIFQSAMNLKSLNAPPSVLPPEEIEESDNNESDDVDNGEIVVVHDDILLGSCGDSEDSLRNAYGRPLYDIEFNAYLDLDMEMECFDIPAPPTMDCLPPRPMAIPSPPIAPRKAFAAAPRMVLAAAPPMADITTYQKKRVEHHYERLENTKEYQEGFYYQSTDMFSPVNLVPNSAFWASFAHYLRSGSSAPFLSKDFIMCTHSVSEVLFCLSVLGIQSEEASYHLKRSQLVTNSPVFVFNKMLKEGTKPTDCPLMVLTKYIDNSNHWKTVNGEKVERFMETNEFVAGVSYTCMIVITNVAPIQQVVEVMYQIPRGSYPLSNIKTLVNEVKTIDAFSTCTISYSFYFPKVGDFEHLPAHIIDSTKATILAVASPAFSTLHCVKEAKTLDVTSWKDVAINASEDVLLDYIRTHNVKDLEWKYVLGRLSSPSFFKKLIAELRGMRFYYEDIWKYGVKYCDWQSTKDLVGMRMKKKVGLAFSSPLLTIDSAAEELFNIREYKPYVNNRCFRLGESMNIPNDKLKKQYELFLKYLTQKKPTCNDYALLVYYLILQDRVMTALSVFKKFVCEEREGRFVPREGCVCNVQVDYMIAYFDCFTESLTQAREICARYECYPVLYWRNLFSNISSMVKSVDGTMDVETTYEIRDESDLSRDEFKSKRSQMHMDSALDVSSNDQVITLHYCNLREADINLYELDVELLFSLNPFVFSKSSSLFIRPNYSQHVQLPLETDGMGEYCYPLPKEYKEKNVLVEVRSGTLCEACHSLNNSLLIALSVKSGQLRVMDKKTHKGIPCCYVKVYAETNSGRSKFLKDGFTDISGCFDYYSVSTEVAEQATKLAIFVNKEGYGSCIREALPPISAAY